MVRVIPATGRLPATRRGPEHPASGEVFETTDVEYAEHVLSSRYGNLKVDGHGQRGGMRLARAALGPSACLDHNSFTMSFDTTGTRLGALLIGHLRSGRLTIDSDGTERSYGPGDVFLAVLPGQRYSARSASPDIELAVIDLALLTEVAEPAPGRKPQPARLTGCEPASPQAARQWRATYAYVRDTVLTRPETDGQPLVTASASRLLAATALAAFPNNALTDPTSGDRRDANPATLRQAIAFIDDNAHRDITVTDIADAASVTTRAIQLAFQRHLDSTPTGYLRRVRLDRARHDLQAASQGDGTTVTAVAYRWGFTSSSRFAAHYLRAYGTSPSRTLRQD